MPGALVFGAATSDRVNMGSAADIDNLTAHTVIGWFYPTALTSGRFLFSKADFGQPAGQRGGMTIRLSGTTGNLEAVWDRTGVVQYITNDTPLSALNKWYCVMLTADQGQAQPLRIYTGDLATMLAERTYGTANAGSGTFGTDDTLNFMVGNHPTGFTSAFQGRIGMIALFGSVLSLANAQSWQREPRLTLPGGVTALRFTRLGKDGADAIEYSGAANGTVTGATQGNGGPYGRSWTRNIDSQIYQRAV